MDTETKFRIQSAKELANLLLKGPNRQEVDNALEKIRIEVAQYPEDECIYDDIVCSAIMLVSEPEQGDWPWILKCTEIEDLERFIVDSSQYDKGHMSSKATQMIDLVEEVCETSVHKTIKEELDAYLVDLYSRLDRNTALYCHLTRMQQLLLSDDDDDIADDNYLDLVQFNSDRPQVRWEYSGDDYVFPNEETGWDYWRRRAYYFRDTWK